MIKEFTLECVQKLEGVYFNLFTYTLLEQASSDEVYKEGAPSDSTSALGYC